MTRAALSTFCARNGGYLAAAQLLADIADCFDLDDPEFQAWSQQYRHQSRQCLALACEPLNRRNVS
jgi:hypothetical protein